MIFLGPIGFATPWLLWGLAVLPVLWLLLRAVPPAPIRRRFPGVALLLGLTDDESQSDKTPWWLLLLRMLLIAAVIVGLAGPILNPQADRAGSGPLLVLIDGTWADARDWPARQDRIAALLDEAGRAGRPVSVATLTGLAATPPAFQAASVWSERLPGLRPEPWQPQPEAIEDWINALGDTGFETWWFSDGLSRESRALLLDALEARGPVSVFQSARPLYGLRAPIFENGEVKLSVTRMEATLPTEVPVAAIGLDPAGQERVLSRGAARFDAGELDAEIAFVLPPELLGRVSRFTLEGVRSAAAVALTDDALRRREVALITGRQQREGLELLSPTHYLEKALLPTADLLDGALSDILPANPDVIVLADVATLPESQTREVAEWVAQGGLLLRFAGPQLAGSDLSREFEDPLMPVRLRRGGRSVGGAMSWGAPKELQGFAEESPFYGLEIPEDVRVTSQVLAQPDPTLSDRVIAALADGTPLVTRKRLGDGQIVLFHVTANAEWSTLPLSGLFVEMLERLAVSSRQTALDAEDLAGTTWVAESVLDAFGELGEAGAMSGIAGERLATGLPGPGVPPGLYAATGRDQGVALNVIGTDTRLGPAAWPARIPVEGMEVMRETDLKGVLLALALGFLVLDTLAALWISGRLGRGGRLPARGAGTAALAVVALAAFATDSRAQDVPADDSYALSLTEEVVLAHVLTGDDGIDRVARAGLRGLTDILNRRTSIEPGEQVAIDLERDELTFLPFLYWPVSASQPIPSDVAYEKLNRYLRTGGMILFDTRDAGIAGDGSPEAQRLQQLARPLDIPPLERVPSDHVLTRTFYLLQDFPGRHASRDVWVEAAPPDAEQIEGMPFRNLNDGVTPVIIGGNDWAAAWAIDGRGNRMFPVGRGYAGERQREIALRFGINLIMHVLTGNYKSDQVHVPALLDRLGQ